MMSVHSQAVSGIQKIEWQRSERAIRVESQRQTDSTSDNMTHDTSYAASAAANLSEWAQGSSQSSVTAAAAGGGFALGPFVAGGGVAHSSSNSSSQSSGGRETTASEESQWRDAIRRHGDALRKLESTVVQEVTQTETVTGTTEVIRNINYAHSLTVIYHNILRHLRVDTEFASVRECLYVPFAIRPFTLERALRWQDSIARVLRKRSLARALTYLKDVVKNFANSPIPPGRRSDHSIKALWGSLYIDLGIARPKDKDDGKFDEASWAPILGFLSAPAASIFEQLAATDATLRDLTFQQRYAPPIATKWCDQLRLTDTSGPLDADFTLATPYRFNQTVRIDFQVSASDTHTRETLSSIVVLAERRLPPGSTANIRSISYNYQTDFESGSAVVNRSLNDLIVSETGLPDQGAKFDSVPSAYERQDLQHELRLAATELVNHLNEYVEYYTKAILWNMDRDRLFMLLDGFTVPKLMNEQVSIANVVERDPVAVCGNSLVFRVSAGIFLGSPELKLDTLQAMHDYYNANKVISDPMHISLPTDGLYAQSIMDECNALEEHYGNQDWALNDPDPDLGALDASLLQSRRTDPGHLEPSKLPETIIQLSNGQAAPQPQGFAGILGAVQNANAFRDMAGLAGTQALAQAGLQTAASLATTFGGSAAALEMTRIAGKQQAAVDADKKLASVQRAKDKGLVNSDDASKHANKILQDVTAPSKDTIQAPHEDPDIKQQLLEQFDQGDPDLPRTLEASNAEGSMKFVSGDSAGRDFELVSARRSSSLPARQHRPSWKAFNSVYWKYPDRKSASVIAAINAGWVGDKRYENTCTMRLSQALNDVGTPITREANRILGVVTEFSAQRHQRYLIRVVCGRAWLLYNWGPPDVIITRPDIERASQAPRQVRDDSRIKGKHGVLVFDISFTDAATGHIDIFNGSQFSHEMPGGWDGTDTPPAQYWNIANDIMFWELKGVGTGGGGTGGGRDSDSSGVLVGEGNGDGDDDGNGGGNGGEDGSVIV